VIGHIFGAIDQNGVPAAPRRYVYIARIVIEVKRRPFLALRYLTSYLKQVYILCATMSRLKADFCLFLVALIWGSALVAQKVGMNGLGPFGFTGVRFILTCLVVIPFVIKEWKSHRIPSSKTWLMTLPVCFCCAVGVCIQQVGIADTSVTNAGFITSLYVIFTPFIAWALFRHSPNVFVWPACILSVMGLWFLNGGSFTALTKGDFFILLCAVLYGGHVATTGWFLSKVPRPFFLSITQYVSTMVLGLSGAFLFEDFTLSGVMQNWLALLYAGIISGGLAYTLQSVAQQYTPPANAAIILSMESIVAALTGIWLLSEDMTVAKITGCGFIMLAVFCVEGRAFFSKRKHALGDFPDSLSAKNP
jgi:drug/metabolite transporter (DMT)-like permease